MNVENTISSKIWTKLTGEMKEEKLYLVAQYFSSDEILQKFIKEVDNLTNNIGGGGQYIYCYFPNCLDEYELSIGEGFDGIEFGLFEEKISVDVLTFRKYLQMACEIYWTEYPESYSQLEEYLTRQQPPLEEGTLPLWKKMRDAEKFPKPYTEFE